MNPAQQILMKTLPYNIDQIFSQICQYKIFEVNLKRAILMNDKSNIIKVRLINSMWFEKWKKISCYEGIKDELNMCLTIPENYKTSINNYYQVVLNLQLTEKLDPDINNNSLLSSFDNSLGRCEIDPYSNFELISPELWDCFVPPNTNNINNGTLIELNVDYLTKNSLMINLSRKSCYIIFWRINIMIIQKEDLHLICSFFCELEEVLGMGIEELLQGIFFRLLVN